MFNLLGAPGGEDESDERPISRSGDSLREFQALMKVLYFLYDFCRYVA
jgi:hypothetical protein